MRKTLNVEASPVVGLISGPSSYWRSVVHAARRTLGSTLESDSTVELGSEDSKILAEAIRFRRWWLFAGGSFHFSLMDIPMSTLVSLMQLRYGTVVCESPSVMKFKAAVCPIGMASSAVFTLTSVIERLVKLHEDMLSAGYPPAQLVELLPLGSAVDAEFLIPGDELLKLGEAVTERKDVLRADALLPELVEELYNLAGCGYPEIFVAAKELFYGK